MTEPAISVRGLSKRYRLGAINRHTLSDEITYLYHKLRGRNAAEHMGKIKAHSARVAKKPQGPQDFWALKDVTFDVQPGEIIGIVGGNGAGKSTLLKILSRITEPTEGEAFINGRVGSLLEVGTGFHPELTGRENIFLSGTIQGMKKAEIIRKFDEIVAFSEIDQFLDTPVKRYSSGMFVRLAFAVAAHLDPEILIVDEVLAVGDAAFQKKCLGKMGDVARQGRTILFVSHNMAAVENLCTHALWMEQGKVRMIGDTDSIVEHYLDATQETLRRVSLRDRTDRRGTGRARVVDFFITDTKGKRQTILRPGNTYRFVLDCELKSELPSLQNVIAAIALTDLRNETIWLVSSNFTHENHILSPRISRIGCTVNDFAVAEGIYNVTLSLGHGTCENLDHVTNAAEVMVEGGDFFGTGSRGNPALCKTLTHAAWKVE
jgi:lipopolysaccharide transport system ATP-binding protein